MQTVLGLFIFIASLESQAICFNEQFSVKEIVPAANGTSCTFEDLYGAEQKTRNEAYRHCGNSEYTWAQLRSPMALRCSAVDGKAVVEIQGIYKCCANW